MWFVIFIAKFQSNDLPKLTSLFMIGVVHEHPRIGSDGESEEGSGTSEDPNVSPTSDEIAINNGKQVTPSLESIEVEQNSNYIISGWDN